MTSPHQSESERCAPWGGARDVPMKPMRPYWDGLYRFCTEHGEYKIYMRSNETAYAGYIPNGQSEINVVGLNEDGVASPPRSPFLFASERTATAAIRKHHRLTLRAIRLNKSK